MKNIRFIILFLSIILSPYLMQSLPVYENTAETVAKNYYFYQTGISQDAVVFESIITKRVNEEVYYYIFNIKDDRGFVIVSAEDQYFPIIAFSPEGQYTDKDLPYQVEGWMNHYIGQIKSVREQKIEATEEIANKWSLYCLPFEEYHQNANRNKAVEPLVDDILWDQGAGWNALCPEDPDGPAGHVWAGCVATAMGIVMKYWNYPIHGTGSNTYYASGYGTQTADFGNATYFWGNMQNTQANLFSAHLLYHLGVSVDMGYGSDGSGAYSFEVPYALETYFQYHNDASYVEKSSYTQTDWINLLKAQIDLGRPVYYSGRDSDNGGHAFVCSGYTDDDLFHFNFGWSGSNNGYYSVTDVGGFSYSQAAVINIYPENSNTYPSAPSNLEAVLNTSNFNDFVVELSWDAPIGKELANYIVYRDLEQIANISSSNLSYVDDSGEVGNYYYSVSAEYTNGDESLTCTDALIGMFSVTIKAIDPSNGNNITMAQVSFNNEVKNTTFVGAQFTDVPFGGNYYFNITHANYPETHGYIDVTENKVVSVLMDGNVGLNKIEHENVSIYPIPAEDVLNISFKNSGYFEYKLIDLTGRTRIEGTSVNESLQINIESLSSGYYFLKIDENNTTITLPIIIN